MSAAMTSEALSHPNPIERHFVGLQSALAAFVPEGFKPYEVTVRSDGNKCSIRAAADAELSGKQLDDGELQQWQQDVDNIPVAAHGALVDPLTETRALLQGLESMVGLNFKGAQADAVLCMVGTAQKQVAAALAALERYTSIAVVE